MSSVADRAAPPSPDTHAARPEAQLSNTYPEPQACVDCLGIRVPGTILGRVILRPHQGLLGSTVRTAPRRGLRVLQRLVPHRSSSPVISDYSRGPLGLALGLRLPARALALPTERRVEQEWTDPHRRPCPHRGLSAAASTLLNGDPRAWRPYPVHEAEAASARERTESSTCGPASKRCPHCATAVTQLA